MTPGVSVGPPAHCVMWWVAMGWRGLALLVTSGKVVGESMTTEAR